MSLSKLGAQAVHALQFCALSLVVPYAAKGLEKKLNGTGPSAMGYVPEFHVLMKMKRYNPMFLGSIAVAVTSRIVLNRTAEQGLAHTVAKYGVKAGWSLAAYVAVVGTIVYARAAFTDQAKYAYMLTSGTTENAWKQSPWF